MKARQIGGCLDPETKVLTADLRWVRIEDVQPGDELVATDEGRTENEFVAWIKGMHRNRQERIAAGGTAMTGTRGPTVVAERKMRTAIVERTRHVTDTGVRVILDDGRVLVGTPDHPWLSRARGGSTLRWRKMSELRVGDELRWVTRPWAGDGGYEDGWFGGMLDGEGHFRVRGKSGCNICVSQVRNGAHDRAIEYLKGRGYSMRIEVDHREAGDSSKLGSQIVDRICVNRMDEIFRLIGQTRPTRFIKQRWWEGKSLPGKCSGIGWAKVASVELIPEQTFVDIQTSTKTFIAEGVVTHNSTFGEGALMWKTVFRPGTHGLVAAQDVAQTTYLMDMARLAFDQLPWWMRPNKRYEARGKYIEFDHKDASLRQSSSGLKSAIYAEAANKVSGCSIGKTLSVGHISEVSSWVDVDVLNEQIFPAMRLSKDLICIMESTARGRDGFWFPLWNKAMAGKLGDWVPVFVPAYVMKEYSLPTDSTFQMTKEEVGIRDRIQREEGAMIPDGHFAWRRVVVEEFSLQGEDPDKFMQEYPETPTEAFQSSGLCAFDKRKLQIILNTTVRRPDFVGEIGLEGRTEPVVQLHPHDPHEEAPSTEIVGCRLRVWEQPESGRTYYVSADVAQGIKGGDYSCIQVIRIGHGMEPDEQVAEWHGWISPTPFSRVLAAIGYWYNEAEIACELNEFGRTTGTELWRILEYEKLYQWKHNDKIKNFLTDYLGWVTNGKNRDELITKMREAIADENYIIRSEDLISEMFDFGNDGGGRFEAVTGHDDRVMSAMIGRYCAHESDSGFQPSKSKSEVKKRPGRPRPLAMTEFSPIHDRPRSEQGRLYYDYNVPPEYVAMVSRPVAQKSGLLRDLGDDADGWRRL